MVDENKSIKNKAKQLEVMYFKQYSFFADQVNEYIEKYGNDKSEYLNYRIKMREYYSGSYMVAKELSKDS